MEIASLLIRLAKEGNLVAQEAYQQLAQECCKRGLQTLEEFEVETWPACKLGNYTTQTPHVLKEKNGAHNSPIQSPLSMFLLIG